MKRNILILVLLIINHTANCQLKKTNWETDNLNGRVKSIHTICYDEKYFPVLATPEELKVLRLSNYLIKHNSHSIYNENGYYIEYKSGYISITEQFTYNNKGQLIVHNTHSRNIFTDSAKFTFEYDLNGYLNLKMYYDPISEMLWYCTYIYNGDKIISQERISSDKSLLYKWLYTYDTHGNITKHITQNESGISDTSSFTYNYDDQGNILELCEYKSQILISKKTYKYNSDGSKTEELEVNSDGKKIKNIKYDLYGNAIEEYNYREDGNYEINYVYEYDAQHNWIKKVKRWDGNPYELYERVIVYY